MSIIISKPGIKAIRVDKSRFAQEADLQKYIFENPEAIPLQDIKPDVQIVILERESPTSVGSIDVLGVDNDGELYIIETKLYRNPDKRKVLAQVLDYGAALWAKYGDPEAWISELDRRLMDKSGVGLSEKLNIEFGDANDVREGMKESLSKGTFQFLILMDEVSTALKDLILYLNENSSFTIFAVELEYYLFDDQQILIPHVYGAESRKKSISGQTGQRRQWDKTSFFIDAEKKMNEETLSAVHYVYEECRKITKENISWGTGKNDGSFSPKVDAISLRSLFSVYSDGRLSLNYYWLDDNEYSKTCREKLKEMLSAIEPFGHAIKNGVKKYPYFKSEIWLPHYKEFIQIIKEFVESSCISKATEL